jgi:hypothetical protein
MEMRYHTQPPKPIEVTYGQAEAALKSLPVYLLPEAYEYLRSLAEDAKVLALVEAGWNEPSRPIEELFATMDA